MKTEFYSTFFNFLTLIFDRNHRIAIQTAGVICLSFGKTCLPLSNPIDDLPILDKSVESLDVELDQNYLPPASLNENEGITSVTGGMKTIRFGETVSFEELGPVIVNADGTTRRISNWDTLTKAEQESSWRVIAARNKRRLKVLEGQHKSEEEEIKTATETEQTGEL